MKACPQNERLQDYLDGLLPDDRAEEFRTHLQGCASCALELAILRRVVARVAALPDFETDPSLTEHILERVLPSRERRRRWMRILGWSYAGVFAALVAGAGGWLMDPAARTLVANGSVRLSTQVVQSLVFVLNALSYVILSLADGWGLVQQALQSAGPVGRALAAALMQPAIGLASIGALAACAGVLWWMRPRSGGSRRGVPHVGVLGF